MVIFAVIGVVTPALGLSKRKKKANPSPASSVEAKPKSREVRGSAKDEVGLTLTLHFLYFFNQFFLDFKYSLQKFRESFLINNYLADKRKGQGH